MNPIVHVEIGGTNLDKAEALGATEPVGSIAIPTGQFAWLNDPTGTTIGLWQAA